MFYVRKALGIAILGAASLLTQGSTPASASTTAAAEIERAWSSVPQFPTAPALVHGQVVNSAGTPAAGATVILFPVLTGHLKAGTNIPALARTATGADGSFTVRLPIAQDAELVTKRSGGALNLHVMAFYPGGVAQWFYSLPAQKNGRGAPSSALPSAQLILHAAPQAAQPNASGTTIAPDYCIIENSYQITGIPVAVAYKESGDSNLAEASFTYGSTSSMTLGAGISYTNATSGFSQNGTVTQSSGESNTFSHMPGAGNNLLLRSGIYDDDQIGCSGPGGGSLYWTLTQNSVGGSKGTPGVTPVSTGDCISTAPYQSITNESDTQITVTTGVNLSAEGYGINLSSQVGFTSQASITYTMGSQGHPLCGKAAYPSQTNRYIGVIGVH